MYIKFIITIFAFFLSRGMFANNYMMNCTSPDYKHTAFYKFVANEKKLLFRPMKKKWTNFCLGSDNNSKEECKVNGLEIKKNILSKTSKKTFKILYILNFSNYTLIEKRLPIDINNNKTLVYEHKCRKIKI